MQSVPLPIPSRQWLTEHLTHDHMLSPALSAWLASSLGPMGHDSQQPQQHAGQHGHPGGQQVQQHGGLGWTFDPHGAQDLYKSYCNTNLWPVCERPPHGAEVHLVRAMKSDRWYPEMLDALGRTAEAHAGHVARMQADGQHSKHVGRFVKHELPDAGHWLHVDNPSGLMQLMLPCMAQAAMAHA